MSGDWWANQIGTAAVATTPTGTVPQYDLATSFGLAPWQNHTQFTTAVEDIAKQTHKRDIERVKAAKEQSEMGWFQKAVGAVGEDFSALAGSASLFFQDPAGYFEGDYNEERRQQYVREGGRQIQRFSESQVGQAIDAPFQALATPFVASTQEDIQNQSKWWFMEGDNWAKAWEAAEERSVGEAIVDWVISGTNPNISSNKDLDRIRRTNSLYGITAFGADLALGWKLDPTVLVGKGIGEANAIRHGKLPSLNSIIGAEALRTARGQGKYRGLDPAKRYGAWRGELIFNNFEQLRTAARDMSFTDFSNMSMFRRKATNGASAALAFKVASENDELWDLTQRAVLADPDAWYEIKAMKEGTRPLIPGADTKTFIDAFEAQKTKYSELDSEIKDLEARISAGDKEDVLFHYYSKELHASLDKRKADLETLAGELEQYDDYNTWLDTVPSFDNPSTVEQVKARPATLDFLSRKTYQKNKFGKVHQIHEISKAGWLREANPIDLHRVDTGVQSIRRQFEQFDHFFGYRVPDELDDTLQRFTQAVSAGRHNDAYKIAKEVEDTHLVRAIADWSKRHDKREGTPGISQDTIAAFFDQVKFQRNKMVNALVSGDGAVYTTLDGDRAASLGARNGIVDLELTEGGKRITARVPEDALKAHLPQDPTQTANFYMPLNTREVFFSIKHDPELWELLDDEVRHAGRKAAALTFNSIDTAGTAWNRFWKPLQLFRLAWPQRVLMDESLRGLAVLKTSDFARNYANAFRVAATNAVNPLEHPGTFPGAFTGVGAVAASAIVAPGLAPFIAAPALLGGAFAGAKAANAFVKRRKNVKIGPGPISDELSGRNYDVAAHEEALEAAPAVPSYYAPQRNAKRSVALNSVLANAKADRAYRNHRAAARDELGDTNFSLVEEDMFPAKRPVAPFYTAIEKAFAENWGDGSSVTFDPLNGKPMKSGFGVPVATQELRAGTRLGDGAADEIEAFVERNQELLGSNGYRLMVRQQDGVVTLSVVRHFKGKNIRQAADFSRHVGNDFITDLNDGGLEYYREWLDEDALALDAQIAEVEKALDDEPTDLTVEALDLKMQETMDKMAERPRLLRRREFARGQAKFRAGSKTFKTEAALEGPGEVYTTLMSGAPAYARLTDAYKRTLNSMRSKAVGYKRIMPPQLSRETLSTKKGREQVSEYYTAWADLLNNQVRNSPIWFQMLEGKTDDQIVRWLENSAEGAKLRRELPHKGHNPERWVEEHRQALDMYLPRTDLQALLKEQRLQPSDLYRIEQDRLPEIYGEDLELIEGRDGFGRIWGDFVQKTYTALGTVPTDTLSRQPFFKSMYDLKMRNLIRATDEKHMRKGKDGYWYITDEVAKSYQKLSREFALRQVKRTMYDLGDDTNFTQAIRFLAPFWGAQQEALTKWANIIIERPETFARFYVGIDAAYNNFQVIDEDGKPVKGPRKVTEGILGYDPNDRIMLQVPKALSKVAPFDKILAGNLGEVGFSLGSANTALQGDMFFMPSLGPTATVPADLFAKSLWEDWGTSLDDEFFYRWLFPVGRPKGKKWYGRAMEQVLPGWGKRMQSLHTGLEDHTYANTFTMIHRELSADRRKRGLPPPSAEEIKAATDWHFALRELASFGLPVAAQFRPKNQFYLDEIHRMQEKFGGEALERFVQKYGVEAAQYAASSSDSVAGVPPTAQGMKEWKGVRDLIGEYPEWGSAMMSPEAWEDDFSSDAYNAQFNIALGPGTSQPLREFRDPQERMEEVDVQTGWIQFRKIDSAITAELYARGLTSIQQKGAEDLAQIKQQFVTELATRNEAWNDDFQTLERNAYARVRDLGRWAFDPRFDGRRDIQGVRQYLMLREAATQSLDMYHVSTGGSRSLQADENAALRQWFYGQVGALIMDNPAFGEFYSRYLSSDRLDRGSGP